MTDLTMKTSHEQTGFIHISLQWRHLRPKSSQITSGSTVCLTVCHDRNQRKHQRFAKLALYGGNLHFVGGLPPLNADKYTMSYLVIFYDSECSSILTQRKHPRRQQKTSKLHITGPLYIKEIHPSLVDSLLRAINDFREWRSYSGQSSANHKSYYLCISYSLHATARLKHRPNENKPPSLISVLWVR